MYILKNALKCISRSKGRNILIGIIVLVISIAACVGLSIRQASDNARENTVNSMIVTASISYDMQSMMSSMRDNMSGMDFESGERPSFDRDSFSDMMGSTSSLTLDEYKVYAEASTVKDFYYSSTIYVNGSDNLLPVSTETDSEDDSESSESTDEFSQDFQVGMPGGMGGMGGFGGMMMTQSDFTLEGVSSDSALTSFGTDGTASISEGAVFDEGTENFDCIISDELAIYNSLEVGDVITITNPSNEEETYELTVVGLYTDTDAGSTGFSVGGFSGSDPVNKIYISYTALESIVTYSEENSVEVTDENTGRTFESAFSSDLEATYVFANPDDYYTFEEEVRDLGLDESYVVNSNDINAFESSLEPLETLGSMAGVFLIVILAIGAVILIVLNIFSVRERKYEIGVLTAMGMKKGKVAIQFITEIFMVTIVAVIIGIVVGGVSSVPVTNALLKNQAASQQQEQNNMEMNFGRPGDFGGGMPGGKGGSMPEMGNVNIEDIDRDGFRGMFDNASNYISEINSAMNLTVVLQMFLIAVGLTLVAGGASVLFIMRYEPLKILANRD